MVDLPIFSQGASCFRMPPEQLQKIPLRGALSWRPGHRASAEQMHVEMGDGLPSVRTVVDDETESGICEAFGSGDLSGGAEQMPEEFGVRRNGFRQARDHPLGNHEDVNRCPGGNIAEREAPAVLENNVGRNLSGDDFFEQRHESWRSCARWLRSSSPRTNDTISPLRPEQSRRQFFAARNSFTHR